MKTFSELSLSPRLQANLAHHGFTVPTPIQAMAIEPALARRNLVATAQTGTGKTLAFVLPVIQVLGAHPGPRGIRAVILSPTRELALQINESFVQIADGTGVSAAVVVGGLSEKSQLQSIRKGAQVLIATAGRLYDFLSRGLVNLAAADIVVLDEADRMLDMGFLPTIKRIMAAIPSSRQTLFFSATIENAVQHLVEAHAPNAIRIAVGPANKAAEQVDFQFYEVEQDRKLELLDAILRREEGSFLVFARTKRGAERLARRLADQGVKTAAIHGDRSQNQRNQALRGFREGHYRVLVATDIASRGIHVDGISHVVNYDLPQAPEDFIHRVGRTGRAGARGKASTFVMRSERKEVAHIRQALGIHPSRDHEAAERPADPADLSRKPQPRRWRSFGPVRRAGRVPIRRAV
jgi:ATP-dependent RNA helicase RhlE